LDLQSSVYQVGHVKKFAWIWNWHPF
jgi:hypothetical protein